MKLRILVLVALGCAALPMSRASAQGSMAPLQLQPKHAPVTGAGKRQAPPPTVQLYDGATVIQKADAYLNSATSMIANFVQIGPDGRRTEGTLSVQRPGRLRFQYDPPATLDIVADGTTLAVRDRQLDTQSLYFVSQTPLKFLLDQLIDLARDTRVTNVTDTQNAATIDLVDSAAFGGTANIELVFDPVTFALKQWTVTDAQGYKTLVTLFNVDLTARPDPALFYIDQTRYGQ